MSKSRKSAYFRHVFAKMPRDIKLSIFQLIKEQNEKNFTFFISILGLNKPKNHFTLLTNRNCKHFRGQNRRFRASEEVTGRVLTIIDCIEVSRNYFFFFIKSQQKMVQIISANKKVRF
jgi:hypothetical protein